MNEMQIVEYNNIRVVTTKQIAEIYDTTPRKVSNNFNNNKSRYVEGKHYFLLSGEELKKLQSQNLGLQNSKTRTLYLWTERGALLLAKSINTDIAWAAYERLVDFYFEKKEEITKPMIVDQFPEETPRAFHQPSNTLLPKNPDWFQRNNRRMTRICNKAGVKRSVLYHHILLRLGEEYDLNAANKIYEEELGYPPEYAIDIVSYFKQLADMADKYLDGIEKLEETT